MDFSQIANLRETTSLLEEKMKNKCFWEQTAIFLAKKPIGPQVTCVVIGIDTYFTASDFLEIAASMFAPTEPGRSRSAGRLAGVAGGPGARGPLFVEASCWPSGPEAQAPGWSAGRSADHSRPVWMHSLF